MQGARSTVQRRILNGERIDLPPEKTDPVEKVHLDVGGAGGFLYKNTV
jgi:hypothetical protein